MPTVGTPRSILVAAAFATAAATLGSARAATAPHSKALLLVAQSKASLVIVAQLAERRQDFHAHLDYWRTPHVIAKLRVVATLKGDPGGEIIPVAFTRKGIATVWPAYKKASRGKATWPRRRVVLFLDRAGERSTPGSRFDAEDSYGDENSPPWFVDDSPGIESFLAKAGEGCLATALPPQAEGEASSRGSDACARAVDEALRSGFLAAAAGPWAVERFEVVPNPSRSLCAVDCPWIVGLRNLIVIDSRLACAPAWASPMRARMGGKPIEPRYAGGRDPVWLDDLRFAFLSDAPDSRSDLVFLQDLRNGEVSAERAAFRVQSLECVAGQLTAEGWSGESQVLDRPCVPTPTLTRLGAPGGREGAARRP